jgi:hypothetical protein
MAFDIKLVDQVFNGSQIMVLAQTKPEKKQT